MKSKKRKPRVREAIKQSEEGYQLEPANPLTRRLYHMNEDFEEFEIVLTFPVVLMEELTEEEAREYAALMAASEQDGGEQ